MFFWNSLAVLMIQWMLAIWSLDLEVHGVGTDTHTDIHVYIGLSWRLSGKAYIAAYIAVAGGDMGSVPELERSPGGGHDDLHQCSCLENPMNRGAWRATVQRFTKRLKQLSTTQHRQDYKGKPHDTVVSNSYAGGNSYFATSAVITVQ